MDSYRERKNDIKKVSYSSAIPLWEAHKEKEKKTFEIEGIPGGGVGGSCTSWE